MENQNLQPKTTKKCRYCQTNISLEAKKCPNCRSDLRSWSHRHQILSVLILIGVIIGTLAVVGKMMDSDDSSVGTSSIIKQSSLSLEEIKDKAIKGLSYDELLRNNKEYIGEIVYYKGEVGQVTEIWGNKYILRIYITKGEYGFWDDDIYVNYEGERILEDDIIDFWGEVKGVKKYTTVLGGTRSIPEIDTLHLEVEKSSTSAKSSKSESTIQYSTQQSAPATSLKSTSLSSDLPKSEPVPSPPTESIPEKIEGLTKIRVGSGIWENWDADMEKDGPVLDIAYYDNNDKIISTYETVKVPISIDLRIYTKNMEDIPYVKGRLVFSAHFTDNQILKTSSIYPKIRVPGEEISINPSIDYQYGYVELILHTPDQGDFSDESDFIVLYDD